MVAIPIGDPLESLSPARCRPAFDLPAFARAIEAGDITHQLAAYADEAEVRIINPDNPPRTPQIRRGKSEIEDWIRVEFFQRVGSRVVDLVDGDDRIAFTEERQYQDGTVEFAMSTAELADGLITRQSMILVWDRWD